MTRQVLVADSDGTTLELVTAVLTRDGFEVVGERLGRIGHLNRYAIALIELQLPRRLRGERRTGVPGQRPARNVALQYFPEVAPEML